MSSAGGDVEYMFAQTSSGVAIDLDGRITLEGVSPTSCSSPTDRVGCDGAPAVGPAVMGVPAGVRDCITGGSCP
jgi:hypothetical protein